MLGIARVLVISVQVSQVNATKCNASHVDDDDDDGDDDYDDDDDNDNDDGRGALQLSSWQ